MSKVEHLFHAICLVMHRLQHMGLNFLHRLVQAHHTMPEPMCEHYTYTHVLWYFFLVGMSIFCLIFTHFLKAVCVCV